MDSAFTLSLPHQIQAHGGKGTGLISNSEKVAALHDADPMGRLLLKRISVADKCKALGINTYMSAGQFLERRTRGSPDVDVPVKDSAGGKFAGNVSNAWINGSGVIGACRAP